MLAQLVALLALGQAGPTVEVRAGSDPTLAEVVVTLDAQLAKLIPAGKVPFDTGERHLKMTLADKNKNAPGILGTYHRTGAVLVFRPRFPLQHGEAYKIWFTPAGGDTVVVYHRVPPLSPGTPPVVKKVYPTGSVLPANHLRFYIYFSRPMRGGATLFSQLVILDDQGRPVLDPWLHDEIWIENDTVLVLYIHPGRIKWGLRLRETVGPALLPEREYTFVIKGDLADIDGRTLGKDYVKKFRTLAEDRTRLDLDAWNIKPPAAGSRAALVIELPKPHDHMSLLRFVTIVDVAGKPMPGTFEVGPEERVLMFVPGREWSKGEYSLTVQARLEDVAGNTFAAAFDVDLKAPPLPPPRLARKFEVK